MDKIIEKLDELGIGATQIYIGIVLIFFGIIFSGIYNSFYPMMLFGSGLLFIMGGILKIIFKNNAKK
jgi:hypothetical protein